jgi:hypothetical protein
VPRDDLVPGALSDEVNDRLLSPEEAAAHLGIGLKKLRALGLPHQGEYYRKYQVAVLDRWLDANGTSAQRRSTRTREQFSRYRRCKDPFGKDIAASSHPLYETWRAICRRTSDGSSPDYGGRGIMLYEPWRQDPGLFFKWIDETLGPRRSGRSLDRIDVDGNYEPDNLRWATAVEQNRNRRNSLCRCYCCLAGVTLGCCPHDDELPPHKPPLPQAISEQEARLFESWDLGILQRELDDLLSKPAVRVVEAWEWDVLRRDLDALFSSPTAAPEAAAVEQMRQLSWAGGELVEPHPGYLKVTTDHDPDSSRSHDHVGGVGACPFPWSP